MKTTNSVLAVLAALAMVATPVAGVTTGPAAVDASRATAQAPATTAATTAGDATNHTPADPESDRLGWEKVGGYGVWSNESIAVDNSDGVNQTELDQLIARTMARIERIRRLEFQSHPPVTVRSREAYSKNISKAYTNISWRNSLHQNVKYEATFMVGENTDAIAELENLQAANVLGFYDPKNDTIVVVSDDEQLQMDGFTLAHELVHALQDQQFNITRYNRTTEDVNNGVSGIVEGDASLVEDLYKDRCNRGGPWNGTCVRPASSRGGGGNIHIGIYLVGFNPYSDGPPFVQEIRQRGGWEAVNAVYNDTPASSEQVIHPEKYPDDVPTDISIDRSAGGGWHVLNLTGGSIDYATFGEAGLFAMFWYPSYETRSDQIVSFRGLFSDAQYDTYDYTSEITAGWDGDKLLPFVTEASNRTNETGYIWKSVWDSPKDAKQFVDGYKEMLEYRNGKKLTEQTWYIPQDSVSSGFSDVFYVKRDGDTVVVVNGPTIADVRQIDEGAAPNAPDEISTPTPTPTPDEVTPTPTTTPPPTDTSPGSGDGGASGSGGQPGFGTVVAVLAVAGALLALRRRN